MAGANSLNERTWKNDYGQEWHYEETLGLPADLGHAVLRIVIKVGNCVDYTSGLVERWDGGKWQELCHRAGPELACCPNRRLVAGKETRPPISYTDRELSADGLVAFRTDRDTLYADAVRILEAAAGSRKKG